MPRVTLLKDGQPCAEPWEYAERRVPLDVYWGVLQILAKPAVAALGSLEYNILEQMLRAGLAETGDIARWHFQQIAGWLSEQGLLTIKMGWIGTAGATRHFYKLAEGAEVQVVKDDEAAA